MNMYKVYLNPFGILYMEKFSNFFFFELASPTFFIPTHKIEKNELVFQK